MEQEQVCGTMTWLILAVPTRTIAVPKKTDDSLQGNGPNSLEETNMGKGKHRQRCPSSTLFCRFYAFLQSIVGIFSIQDTY